MDICQELNTSISYVCMVGYISNSILFITYAKI